MQREQYCQVPWCEIAMENNAGNGQVASWTKVKHPRNGRKASHRKREGEVKDNNYFSDFVCAIGRSIFSDTWTVGIERRH